MFISFLFIYSLSLTDSVFSLVSPVIGILVMAAAYFQIFLFIIAAERQIIRMRLAFFRNVLRQEVGWFDTNTAGELSIKLTE